MAAKKDCFLLVGSCRFVSSLHLLESKGIELKALSININYNTFSKNIIQLKFILLKGDFCINAIQTSEIDNNFTTEELKKIALIY
jgi:hypothetical protein